MRKKGQREPVDDGDFIIKMDPKGNIIEAAVAQGKWARALNDKQRRFVDTYVAGGCSNLKAALHAAGYTASDKNAAAQARQILRAPQVRAYMMTKEKEAKYSASISVEEVVSYYNRLIETAFTKGDLTNVNRALESLGKYLNMFIERTELTVKQVRSKEEVAEELDRMMAIYQESKPLIRDKFIN